MVRASSLHPVTAVHVPIHYHAYLREKLGRDSELLVLSPEKANAAGIVDAFVAAHPEFAQLASALNVAVDDEIVAREATVQEGSRVDLLPPYGGG